MKAELYDIIRSPVVSEKATILAEQNKYIFKVAIDSTKLQIKKAVEKIFGVAVLSVNTIKGHGKIKRFRGVVGKQNDYKKAVVTLAKGNKIDITGGIK